MSWFWCMCFSETNYDLRFRLWSFMIHHNSVVSQTWEAYMRSLYTYYQDHFPLTGETSFSMVKSRWSSWDGWTQKTYSKTQICSILVQAYWILFLQSLEVENGHIWKVASIGVTHSRLPWLWEEGYGSKIHFGLGRRTASVLYWHWISTTSNPNNERHSEPNIRNTRKPQEKGWSFARKSLDLLNKEKIASTLLWLMQTHVRTFRRGETCKVLLYCFLRDYLHFQNQSNRPQTNQFFTIGAEIRFSFWTSRKLDASQWLALLLLTIGRKGNNLRIKLGEGWGSWFLHVFFGSFQWLWNLGLCRV